MSRSADVRVVREVSDEALFGAPIRRFFQRLMLAAHRYAATPGHVPIDTDRLRRSLAPGGGVTSSGDDFAQVGTNVETYPRVLEESPRYLYRDGPSRAQPTQGWLSKTVPAMKAEVGDLLSNLAGDMEGAFRG